MAQAKNGFDFDSYNAVMKTAGAGLKLFLVQQLMQDIEQTCVRFRNPLTKDISDITDELISVRAEWRKLAEQRENISQVAKQADDHAAGLTERDPNAPLSQA